MIPKCPECGSTNVQGNWNYKNITIKDLWYHRCCSCGNIFETEEMNVVGCNECRYKNRSSCCCGYEKTLFNQERRKQRGEKMSGIPEKTEKVLLTVDEKLEMIALMKRYGGSFVQALAVCFERADSKNFQILSDAFPDFVKKYSLMKG